MADASVALATRGDGEDDGPSRPRFPSITTLCISCSRQPAIYTFMSASTRPRAGLPQWHPYSP